jgi:hypothetical protein
MIRSIAETRRQEANWTQEANYYRRIIESTGSLPRSDWWRYEYCQTPYLMVASNEYLAQRWIDQYHNNCRLTAAGQLAPRQDFADASGMYGPLFTHLTMEYQTRGGIPDAVVAEGSSQLDKYFRKGEPTGIRLFQDYPETIDNVIVKFGKKEHIEAMLATGEVRVTPSSFYSRGSLLKAMRDLESEREFHVPVFNAVLAGKTHATIQGGFRGEIIDGFVKERVECPNYVLWCACRDIDRRMPDDFEADTALIIRSPNAFAARFHQKLKTMWPGIKASYGPVQYYDPCSFTHRKVKPVHLKHFSFSYQREWRFSAFPIASQMPEEPFTTNLGSLTDIADLVTLAM